MFMKTSDFRKLLVHRGKRKPEKGAGREEIRVRREEGRIKLNPLPCEIA